MKYCGKQAQLVKLCQCRMLEIERITTRFHSCFSKQPVGAYLLCRSRCARRGKIATYRVCRVASPRVPSSLDRPSIRVTTFYRKNHSRRRSRYTYRFLFGISCGISLGSDNFSYHFCLPSERKVERLFKILQVTGVRRGDIK